MDGWMERMADRWIKQMLNRRGSAFFSLFFVCGQLIIVAPLLESRRKNQDIKKKKKKKRMRVLQSC